MTAFLFIPASVDGSGARRVDFGNIASLFTEGEEPVRRSNTTRNLFRAAAAVLLLLIAFGDTLLVTRPGPTTSLPAARTASARAIL